MEVFKKKKNSTYLHRLNYNGHPCFLCSFMLYITARGCLERVGHLRG